MHVFLRIINYFFGRRKYTSIYGPFSQVTHSLPPYRTHSVYRRTAMEYWDAEVLPGVPFNSQPREGYLLHITKAMLLETYKGDDPVCLFLSVDCHKHVLGRLSSDKFPQITYNLIFDKPIELSHSGNDESVYFSGYESKSDDRALSEEPLEDSNDESEDDGSKDCTGGKEVMLTIRKTAHGIYVASDGYAHEENSDVDEEETDPKKLEYLANEDQQKTLILGGRMLVSSAGLSA
ncbi:histone deacetylase HDT1-like [Papaver somniferum]|nr:histone deacetylase HDT1-like [Papaver somniferum]XP_026425078.1 histone deacetylase HDT1-like [Papaver somniferum]